MPEGVFLGFDFGFKHIGVAVGQQLTQTATPLDTLSASDGVPNWTQIDVLVKQWKPRALIIGYPTQADGSKLYVSKPATQFADALKKRFNLPIHLVDERLTTKEARAQLFEMGGYRKLKKQNVDGIAAKLILEQWLKLQAG